MRRMALALLALGFAATLARADATIWGSDGTRFNRFDWGNGDSTIVGSDGSRYNTFRWSNGDTTTFGSDGRRWNTFEWGRPLDHGTRGGIRGGILGDFD
jgi:hypothetical protein